MPDDANKDQDLLARLNALKKSPIDLANRIYQTPGPQLSAIGPNPARSLHSDLLSRFKSLSGNAESSSARTDNQHDLTLADADSPPKDESGMAIEELLADLGPSDQWNIDKSEEDQVSDLLKSANVALSQGPTLEPIPGETDDIKDSAVNRGGDNNHGDQTSKAMPAIDVSAFQPEPESDLEDDHTEDKPKPTKREAMQEFEREADDVLKRLMDEVKYESGQQQQSHESGDDNDDNDSDDDQDESDNPNGPVPNDSTSNRNSPSRTTTTSSDRTVSASARSKGFADLDLPSAPSKDPPPAYSTIFPPGRSNQATRPTTTRNDSTGGTDAALAARFANLSLPSAPTSKLNSPNPSSTAKPTSTSSSSANQNKGFSDDEIDTWCIICSDDATLSCIGCDGDLYCMNCWLEGHRGEGAGFEERRHKAVQYNKGTKKKGKAKTRRLAMGA